MTLIVQLSFLLRRSLTAHLPQSVHISVHKLCKAFVKCSVSSATFYWTYSKSSASATHWASFGSLWLTPLCAACCFSCPLYSMHLPCRATIVSRIYWLIKLNLLSKHFCRKLCKCVLSAWSDWLLFLLLFCSFPIKKRKIDPRIDYPFNIERNCVHFVLDHEVVCATVHCSSHYGTAWCHLPLFVNGVPLFKSPFDLLYVWHFCRAAEMPNHWQFH